MEISRVVKSIEDRKCRRLMWRDCGKLRKVTDLGNLSDSVVFLSHRNLGGR
jgi:hypothetical protein